ncbi:MAG: Dynamin-like 120 kDa protein, mitochondrial, variant 3 [Marteilia pararefringens]
MKSQEFDLQNSKQNDAENTPLKLYSDILNYLQEFNDQSFNLVDHLPRIIVVGDQSSGKTSVLEMLINARIFPRGSGKMMTKSPIQVTLSNGPRHIACFKGGRSHEYSLDSQADLLALRLEIERRMLAQIEPHQTVSDRPIYLDISGPGLQQMILIDLPGLINTVTTELAETTKDDIETMVKKQIENPNAVILCIQDGSIDAERSSVSKLVAQADPKGNRTIFVLNKSDLAERNLSKQTVEKILSGKLFPMRASAYFAIVSGTDDRNSSIEEIKKHEEKFFRNSKFFKTIQDKNKTSKNFSEQVSECFWSIVKTSLKNQIEHFCSIQNSLEVSWREKYRNSLEIDRDEMFERIRTKFLDSFNRLYDISESFWLDNVKRFVTDALIDDIMSNTFIPCALKSNIDKFRDPSEYDFSTNLTMHLNRIVKNDLLTVLTSICKRFLMHEFNEKLKETMRLSSDNLLFCEIYSKFIEEVGLKFDEKFEWSKNTQNYINILIDNYVDDNRIDSNDAWEKVACRAAGLIAAPISKIEIDNIKQYGFMGSLKLSEIFENQLRDIKDNYGIDKLKSALTPEKQLKLHEKINKATNLNIEIDEFKSMWDNFVQLSLLKSIKEDINECKYLFAYHKTNNLDKICTNCDALIGFNSLFNLSENLGTIIVTNFFQREVKTAENCVKSIFFDIYNDLILKAHLLNYPQIIHAEKLKIVRTIHQKLEELNAVLKNKEL